MKFEPPKILEINVEPLKIFTEDVFKVRIKVDSSFLSKSNIISEDNKNLITEQGDRIISEWGY